MSADTSDSTAVADTAPDDESADGPEREEIDRRRLIRWIALLAFGVPVVVEAATFGELLREELFGDGTSQGVGVGDELLPATATTETVRVSELRGTDGGRTYVLRVGVENPTAAPVELRLSTLELSDGDTVDGVASTGTIAPGETGEVTGAWAVGDATPERVHVTLLRDGGVDTEETVALAAPD